MLLFTVPTSSEKFTKTLRMFTIFLGALQVISAIQCLTQESINKPIRSYSAYLGYDLLLILSTFLNYLIWRNESVQTNRVKHNIGIWITTCLIALTYPNMRMTTVSQQSLTGITVCVYAYLLVFLGTLAQGGQMQKILIVVLNAFWVWFKFKENVFVEFIPMMIYLVLPFLLFYLLPRHDSAEQPTDVSCFAPFLKDTILLFDEKIMFVGQDVLQLSDQATINSFGDFKMMEFESGDLHFKEVTVSSVLGRRRSSNSFFKLTFKGASFNIKAEADISLLDKTYKAFKVVPLHPNRGNTFDDQEVKIHFLNEKRTLIDTLQQFSDMQLSLLARQDDVSHASKLQFNQKVIQSSIAELQHLTELLIVCKQISENNLIIRFTKHANATFLDYLLKLLSPQLINCQKNVIQIQVQEMTPFPESLRFDSRIYQLILNLLVSLILKQIKNNELIKIDVFYFLIDQFQQVHFTQSEPRTPRLQQSLECFSDIQRGIIVTKITFSPQMQIRKKSSANLKLEQFDIDCVRTLVQSLNCMFNFATNAKQTEIIFTAHTRLSDTAVSLARYINDVNAIGSLAQISETHNTRLNPQANSNMTFNEKIIHAIKQIQNHKPFSKLNLVDDQTRPIGSSFVSSNLPPNVRRSTVRSIPSPKHTLLNSSKDPEQIERLKKLSKLNCQSFRVLQKESSNMRYLDSQVSSQSVIDLSAEMRMAEFDEFQMLDMIRDLQQRDPQFHDVMIKPSYNLGVPKLKKFDSLNSLRDPTNQEMQALNQVPSSPNRSLFKSKFSKENQNIERSSDIQQHLSSSLSVFENLSQSDKKQSKESEQEYYIEVEEEKGEGQASQKDNCGCKATVLLADDNPFNLMPLQCLLEESFGIQCDLVENGEMEVSAFIANMQKTCCDLRYKLVLTDLNMPVMDGFDAARLILSYCQENFLSVPVAAVTAYDNQSTYDTCIKIGMVAVMNKPISILMLEKIVKKYYFKE